MTGTLTIDALDMATVFSQAQAFYGAFVGMLAAVAGIALGSFVWRRLKRGAMR